MRFTRIRRPLFFSRSVREGVLRELAYHADRLAAGFSMGALRHENVDSSSWCLVTGWKRGITSLCDGGCQGEMLISFWSSWRRQACFSWCMPPRTEDVGLSSLSRALSSLSRGRSNEGKRSSHANPKLMSSFAYAHRPAWCPRFLSSSGDHICFISVL